MISLYFEWTWPSNDAAQGRIINTSPTNSVYACLSMEFTMHFSWLIIAIHVATRNNTCYCVNLRILGPWSDFASKSGNQFWRGTNLVVTVHSLNGIVLLLPLRFRMGQGKDQLCRSRISRQDYNYDYTCLICMSLQPIVCGITDKAVVFS